MNRWDGIYQVLPTRGDCPRKKLSSGIFGPDRRHRWQIRPGTWVTDSGMLRHAMEW